MVCKDLVQTDREKSKSEQQHVQRNPRKAGEKLLAKLVNYWKRFSAEKLSKSVP